MIIFHEGLPRSGKSYEAVKEHIIPALKKGRKVYARINGINHEKIAELVGIDVEQCKSMLIHITEDQVPEIYKHVSNDSLVVIDELQNFWPSGRQKLSDDMTKFVTEHGHRGLDILTMGQSLSDCHNIWRRRTQRKIQFTKMDMVGKSTSYRWVALQGSMADTGEIKFTKINSGVKKYDPLYFGTYASHQAETENKDNLEDARINVFNKASLKIGMPAAFFAACFAVYHLFSFFDAPQSEPPAPTIDQGKQPPPPLASAEPKPQPQILPIPDYDFVQKNSERYTPSITYLSAYKTFVYDALIVWTDDQGRVKDMLYKDDLIELGYTVSAHSYGLKVKKGNWTGLFRWRPRSDPFGDVPKETQDDLKTASTDNPAP